MNFLQNIKKTFQNIGKKRQPTNEVYFVYDKDTKKYHFGDFEFSDKLLTPKEYFSEYKAKYNIDLEGKTKSADYTINVKGYNSNTTQHNVSSYWVYKDYNFYYYLYKSQTALQNPINFATTEIKGLNHCFVDGNNNEINDLKNDIEEEYSFSIEDWASTVTKNLMITGLAVDTLNISHSNYNKTVGYKVLPSHQLCDFYVNYFANDDDTICRFTWAPQENSVTKTYDLYEHEVLNDRTFFTVTLDSVEALPDSRLHAFKNSLGLLYNQILRQSHIYHNGGSTSSLTLISDLLTSGSKTSDGRDVMLEQITNAIQSVKNIEQTGQKVVIPVDMKKLSQRVSPGVVNNVSLNDLIANVDIGGKTLLDKPIDVELMQEINKEAWTVFSFSPEIYGEGKSGLSSGRQADVANQTNSKHVLALLKSPILKLGNGFRFKRILKDLENHGYFTRKFEAGKLICRDGDIERPYTAKDIKYDIKTNVLSPSIDHMKIGLEANKQGLMNNKTTLTKYFGFEESEISDQDEKQDVLENLDTTNKDIDKVLETKNTNKPLENTNRFKFTIKEKEVVNDKSILDNNKSLPKLTSADFDTIAKDFFNKKNKKSLRSTSTTKYYLRLIEKHKELLRNAGKPTDKIHDFSKIEALISTLQYRKDKKTIYDALESQYLSVNLRPIIAKFKKRGSAKIENTKALNKDLLEKIYNEVELIPFNNFLDPEILFRIMDKYSKQGKFDVESQMADYNLELSPQDGERINRSLALWIRSRVENHYIGAPEGETIPKDKDKRLEDLFYSKNSLDVLTKQHIVYEIVKVLESIKSDNDELETAIKLGLIEKAQNRIDNILSGVIIGSFAIGMIISANNTNPITKKWLRTVTKPPRERGGLIHKFEDHLSTVGKVVPYKALFKHVKGLPTFYSQEVPNCRCGIKLGWDKNEINTIENIDYIL